MQTQEQEYSLTDFLEQPALRLAIERRGFDRRSLEPVLRIETCADRRRVQICYARRIDDFIAE
jgi:hypothetical protein